MKTWGRLFASMVEMATPLSLLEISKESLLHNVAVFRSLLADKVEIVAVVKANAYGHGLEQVVLAVENEVDYFQVDDIEELRQLRKLTSKPALLLGYVQPADMEGVVSLGAEISIFTIRQLESLRALPATDRPILVHLAVDSLLGREGVLPSELPQFIGHLKECLGVQVVGAYSHFANIEDTSDFSHAQRQIDTFNQAVSSLEAEGYPGLKTHLSATSGVLAYEQGTPKNVMVRLGIGLYGIWPSAELEDRCKNIELRPAARWVSHVAQVKRLPANHPIGYGLTFVTPQEMAVALIPQGYSDGYDRGLSNCGELLIRGMRCRILGRVAMNMFMVDVSDIKGINEGDEVVLLGEQGEDRISAEEIAQRLGTINYEVVARVSPLLPRRLS
jgi:alanine racemase